MAHLERALRDLPLYLAYRALAGAFGLLPEAAVRRLGWWLGRLAYRFAGDRRRMVRRHMRRVLGPDADVEAAARDVFGYYGRYWAEVFWVTPHRREEIVAHTELVGVEDFRRHVQADYGVVLALAHLGNWEAAGARADAEGGRVLAVAESLPNRRITDWFLSVRNALGMDVVLTGSGGVTRELVARLRDGGVVALLCDRDLKGTGVEVEFFGEVTTMPAGPVALADRTGAVILPVGLYFEEGRGHRFTVEDPLEIPPLETREERVAAGTQLLAKRLEGLIRAHPTQWHLLQANWPSDRA